MFTNEMSDNMKEKNLSSLCVSVVVAFSMAGCGKKEEPKAAAPIADVICSLAPSQSKAVSGLVGTAGGAGATAAALAQALGLTAVTHSSGALILTGSAGYVAGTLGAAAAGPVIVAVGLGVAGSAATIELLCAPKNHPDAAKRVEEAAEEFLTRSQVSFAGAKASTGQLANEATVKIRNIAGDVYEYAFGK